MRTLILCLIIIIQLHSAAGRLRLGLGESDFSTSENQGNVRVTVNSQGRLEEDVTIELIPLSFEEYISGGCGQLPEETKDIDHATPGLDFNATIQTAVVQSAGNGVTELTFNIDIVDDTISERKEVFFLYLRVLNSFQSLHVTRNCSKVYIRKDIADVTNTVIEFSTGSLKVSEGVGMVNDSLFITIQGEAEPTLQVDLLLVDTGNDDIQLLSSKLNISSGDHHISVPFNVLDDLIHEGLECFNLQLLIPFEYYDLSLYTIGLNHTVKVCIVDNDVAKIGFNMSDSPEGSPLVIKEGQIKQVCVSMFEPEELDEFMELTIRLPPAIPDTQAVSVASDLLFYFYNTDHHYCIELSVLEDKLVTPSWNLILTLDLTYSESNVLLEPNTLSLTIKDNHGIPFAPYDIKAQQTYDAKNLLITWKVRSTILQPVNQLVVEVHTMQLLSRVARQQDNDLVQTYRTSANEFILEGIDQNTEYIIRVCAENPLGRMCSEALSLRGDDFFNVQAKTEGVLGLENIGPSASAGDKTYLYIIIAVTLLIVFILLLGGVCVCVGRRLRKKQHYYPSKQESKINRIVQYRESYKSRRSQSTESVNWNSVSDSNLKHDI